MHKEQHRQSHRQTGQWPVTTRPNPGELEIAGVCGRVDVHRPRGRERRRMGRRGATLVTRGINGGRELQRELGRGAGALLPLPSPPFSSSRDTSRRGDWRVHGTAACDRWWEPAGDRKGMGLTGGHPDLAAAPHCACRRATGDYIRADGIFVRIKVCCRVWPVWLWPMHAWLV